MPFPLPVICYLPSPPNFRQKHVINSFIGQIDGPGKFNALPLSGANGENPIRPWAHMFYSCKPYRMGLANGEEYKNLTVSLVSGLAARHRPNHYAGWGDTWQSALWAGQIGLGAWLLWDELPEYDKGNVTNMVLYEADRFIGYEVPYYADRNGNIVYAGDTKGEANAWNARILALASCMFPENGRRDKWESKLNGLLLSSSATLSDLNDPESAILNGSNINEDGTVINHGLYHVDYSSCILEGMVETVIIYALAGRDAPGGALVGLDKIYSALVNVDLGKYDEIKGGHHFYERNAEGNPGIGINMPGENDWGGQWYASYYLNDIVASTFKLDGDCPENLKAAEWASVHFEKLYDMIRNADGGLKGKMFQTGENNFVSGETYAWQNMMKAYLIIKLFSDFPEKP